ncbi:hypothetical protein [Bacillus sp. XF8]|uniref:hypothetical protein n=1 Tax=Bacillus sp. XF8 TaxID=2819289 RepID=UPI001AA09919|nr:hypothetical protein [Bacillus sp. XF8]MBO1583252.1 hypothetical protein [Bacillus sp. XF8]
MTRKTSGEWWLSKKWGYAASVALIPYAILKMLWAFGIPLLVSEHGVEALHVSMRTNADQVSRFLYSYGVDLTVILAIIACTCAGSAMGYST